MAKIASFAIGANILHRRIFASSTAEPKTAIAPGRLTEEERNAALAAIGGKTQIDTLNDLLAGLNTTTEDGRTEWQALNDELHDAEGAMMDMAGT